MLQTEPAPAEQPLPAETTPPTESAPATEPSSPAETEPTTAPTEAEVMESIPADNKVSMGIINSSGDSVMIYAGPGADNAVTGEYALGTFVGILETAGQNDDLWYRTEDGWVSMQNVYMIPETAEGEHASFIARVNSLSSFVNIREEPHVSSRWLGQYCTGDIVEIWEVTLVDSFQPWGRTKDGWFCLSYANPIPEQSEEPALYTGWTCLKAIPVYKEPSPSAKILREAPKAEQLSIYEVRVAEDICWGRCDDGWLDLYSVDLMPVDLKYNDARIIWVNNAPIYSQSNHVQQIGSYEKLTVVQIYEYEQFGDDLMCRTEQGWVREADLPNWLMWYT